MTDTPIEASADIHIAASPEAVYALVADVTRMGEWSPECQSCEWTDGATTAAPGATFLGKNAVGTYTWEVPCEVTGAEPGARFEFLAAGSTRWTYTFAAEGQGTRVTETFHAPLLADPDSPSGRSPGRYQTLVEGCQKTLAAIKAAAEG